MIDDRGKSPAASLWKQFVLIRSGISCLRCGFFFALAIMAALHFGLPLATNGSETLLSPNVTGIWSQPGESVTSFDWQAQWIWMESPSESDMMLARRSFSLATAPDRACLRITASSQYELFVNGQYLARGPARCSPHHQSFDRFELGKLLHAGRNVLAVRVHYQRGTVSYHHQGRGGLLAQLDLQAADGARQLTTDATWKVHADPSWSQDSPLISRFHAEVCDRVNMTNYLRGWKTVAYDDRQWREARPLMRNVGWPSPQPDSRPQALTPPWTSLLLRDIPYLRETEVPVTRLVEARLLKTPTADPAVARTPENPLPSLDQIALSGQVTDAVAVGFERFLAGESPLVLTAPDSENWFLLFDFGTVINGRPQLTVEGSAGTLIDVMCTPYVLDSRFSAKIFDSELIDRIVLSGNRDRWEACYFKPTRYLALAVRQPTGSTRIFAAGIRRAEYPFQEQGSLHTPEDRWYEDCWKAAAETIRVCTTDAYTDNYRERRQYAQTGYYGALGNSWVFGDSALQHRYLRQIAEEQEANGLMPAYAPRTADDFMVILDSNCLWIRSLRNYLLYSGDAQSVRELLPAARKLLRLLDGYTNQAGLLDSPPFAYWLDHARIDRRGANLCLNGHYLGALEDFAQVLGWLDEPDAERFATRAEVLRESLRRQFWVPRRQLFADALVDGEPSRTFSEHANGMALAMQVASPEQAAAVAGQLLARDRNDFVLRESGITMVTPAMSYFLHAGLCRYGYVEDSLRMFRERFHHMLMADKNKTLWEEWWLDGTGRSGRLRKGKTRSDAQTESAFPPALFGEYVLGVRPTAPGLKEVVLFRSPSGLTQVEGTVPSPVGPLTVKWNVADQEDRQLEVKVPGGMRVRLDTSSLAPLPDGSITVDGRNMASASQREAFIELGPGHHVVRF